MTAAQLRTGAAIAAILIVLFVTLVIWKPAMPDRIALLTGPEGSAYHDLGTRYAAELVKRGLDAEVIVTAGGFDNVERLAAGAENAIGFAPTTIESGAGPDLDTTQLVALGAVGYEPLWLFHRSGLDIRTIRDLAGRVVETGSAGTVGDHLARSLIAQNGIEDDVELRTAGEHEVGSAVDRLTSGEVDALFVTGTSGATAVDALLGATGVSFLSFTRGDAYAARMPGVTVVTVPEGVFDLGRNVPPRNSRLLSVSTSLITRDSLNPSVVPMVLDVASTISEASSWVSATTTFPSAENNSLPLDRSAKRYFEQGERGLTKFLPYKVTRLLNHLGFVVLPLLTLVVVLLKTVPLVLRVRSSMQLTSLLKKLEAVEKAAAAGGDRSELLAELDRIDRKSAKMFVPRSTVHDYIDFRQFLHDMRERVQGGEVE